MLGRLVLIFVLVPLAELWLLLVMADRLSWQLTLGLVIVTGILGASLARWQGFRAWTRIQRELESGHMPGDAVLDGLMILMAGLLLLTPGILTDLVGFSLLIPVCRRVYRSWLVRWAKRNVRFHVDQSGPSSWGDRGGVVDGVVEPPHEPPAAKRK